MMVLGIVWICLPVNYCKWIQEGTAERRVWNSLCSKRKKMVAVGRHSCLDTFICRTCL